MKWGTFFFFGAVVLLMVAYPYFLNLKPDLDVYVEAGEAVRRGESPYVRDFIYPPVVAYLFSLLLGMGEVPFKILFCILTLLSLYFTYILAGADRRMAVFVGMGAAALNIAAIVNLLMVFSFKNKSHFLSSLVLSCASVVKIYPFLLIPFHFKKHNFAPTCIAGYLLPPLFAIPTLTRQNLVGFFTSVSQTHKTLLFWIVQSISTFIQYYLSIDLSLLFLSLFFFVYFLTLYLSFFFGLSWIRALGMLWIFYAFLFPYSEAIHMQVLLIPLIWGLENYRRLSLYATLQVTGFMGAIGAYLLGMIWLGYVFHSLIAFSLLALATILKNEICKARLEMQEHKSMWG
jgi:hypothetical protein